MERSRWVGISRGDWRRNRVRITEVKSSSEWEGLECSIPVVDNLRKEHRQFNHQNKKDSRVHGHHVLLTLSTFSVKHEAQSSAESEDREKLSEIWKERRRKWWARDSWYDYRTTWRLFNFDWVQSARLFVFLQPHTASQVHPQSRQRVDLTRAGVLPDEYNGVRGGEGLTYNPYLKYFQIKYRGIIPNSF